MAELDPKALEAACRAFDPNLFSEDMVTAHMAASPYQVEAAQAKVSAPLSSAITAYLSALSPQEAAPGAVGVKKLEWGKTSYGTPEVYSAVGVYRINHAVNGGWTVDAGRAGLSSTDGRQNFATVEDAKAAAQADFDARIRSALTVLPSGQNETGGEVAGWQLVPVERTAEMHAAAQETTGALLTQGHTAEIWSNMLAAAPKPPAASGERNAVVEACARIAEDYPRSIRDRGDGSAKVFPPTQGEIAKAIRALKETPNA